MTETPTRLELARAGMFDDMPLYALADGSRLKVWDGETPPDSALVNLWLDPADEILKRYDGDGWTDAGIVGATGEKGDKGDPGESGESIQGEKGERGARGEAGPKGERGPKGDKGEKGLRGNPGAVGAKGERGEDGERGQKGEKGDLGEVGRRGPRGYSVLSGRRDPDRDDGINGDFWINTLNATVFGPKTDGEWGNGASIRGPIGPRGLTGPQGPPGEGGEGGGAVSSVDGETGAVDLSDDYSPLGHDHTVSEITDFPEPTLEEDSRDESDPIADYPLGVSVMKASALADWNGLGAATVTTIRAGDEFDQTSWQLVSWAGFWAWRFWAGLDWDVYYFPADEEMVIDNRSYFTPVGADALAEGAAITSFNEGGTLMSVTAGANWGPNAGEAGHVLIERNGSTGKQTFAVPATSTSYVRYYTGGAWGGWSSGGGSSDAETLEGEDGAYYLNRTNHTSTQALGTITGHDKAAHDELNIDADTLDGIDSTGFATATGLSDHLADTIDAHDASAISILDTAGQYTATHVEDALAEVLDALQAHEADTTDAHDASAISYAGGTGMSAVNVETAIDELATEKLNSVDLTKAAIDALDVDADTLDGISSAGFATASGLSDHIGDATAAHAASAISYAGGTGMSATDVEAAVDELATEKLNAADYTASDVLSKLLTVDTNTSGLNADTLDGVQGSGYVQTGDYEDADVLAKLLNVDGTGSGLDADLLDGNHAAAFATSGHTHSGLAPTGGTTNQVLKKVSNTNYDYAWAADATGAGGSGGSGEATLDFGAFPGKTDATIAVTGQTDIVSGSLAEAWVFPKATVEHTADEHWVEAIKVFAGNVVAATGFTIYGITDDNRRLYGRYNIAWKWA